jgi:hypothetical protein
MPWLCRNLDHSTVIYEDPSSSPLLRLAWNKFEDTGNFIAVRAFISRARYFKNMFDLFLFSLWWDGQAVQMDSASVILLDVRHPGVPYCTLSSHDACVNSISWAPHSAAHISTCCKPPHIPPRMCLDLTSCLQPTIRRRLSGMCEVPRLRPFWRTRQAGPSTRCASFSSSSLLSSPDLTLPTPAADSVVFSALGLDRHLL